MSWKWYLPLLLLVLVLPSCGSGEDAYPSDIPTGSPPIVSRVDPTSAAAGDRITIFGLGFSSAAPVNIVIVGGAATSADEYALLDSPMETEAESLTATVPEDAAAGETSVVVQVYENTSNGDVAFTVTQ